MSEDHNINLIQMTPHAQELEITFICKDLSYEWAAPTYYIWRWGLGGTN